MSSSFSIAAAEAMAGPDWLRARRVAAAERFSAADLPSVDDEDWRYSRIGDLELEAWTPSSPDAGGAQEPDAETEALVEGAGDDAVVVLTRDGHPTFRRGGAGSAEVCDASEVSTDDGIVLGTALDRAGHDAFVDLHDAFATPIEIRVPEATDGGTVVVIHHAVTTEVIGFPRLVVRAERASRVEVVELFVGPDGTPTLSFPVTELLVGRDATLRHAGIQVLGDAAWQLGRVAAVVETGATLGSGGVSFGGDYVRSRVDTVLDGRGAHGDLHAGYFGTGSQLLDFRTFQDHVAPDTTSNLLFKGALGQKGASVYTGLIKIRPDARGAQAFQTNRNLKLSDDAWAESVPNLEIENNEVQCSHASTVGPVDPEQLFYLESRGVPTARAERLIVQGVFDEVLAALPLGGPDRGYGALVRSHLDRDLERSLS